MKGWVLAPKEDTTRPGALVIRRDGDKQPVTATIKLLDLLPLLTNTTQVWQVELTDHLEVGDWFVTGDKVTYLQKYDVMSVILDVSAKIMDDIGSLAYLTSETAKFFSVRSEAVHDCMSSVETLSALIRNAVCLFSAEMGLEEARNKKNKYNDWLESALKAPTPNSLVTTDKPLTTTYKANA